MDGAVGGPREAMGTFIRLSQFGGGFSLFFGFAWVLLFLLFPFPLLFCFLWFCLGPNWTPGSSCATSISNHLHWEVVWCLHRYDQPLL